MDKKNIRNIELYTKDYIQDYFFESILVKYRTKFLLERLSIYKPKIVVEIGCGNDLLYEKCIESDMSIDKWIIVEPSELFFNLANGCNLPNLFTINGFFENSVHDILTLLDGDMPDFIICSGLLHEVESSDYLLKSIKKIMKLSTILHINVPNANSFHRQLAKSMGIIKSLNDFSERNRTLMQNRVYSIDSLSSELVALGYSNFKSGGYFIKPFTHNQMEQISHLTDNLMLDGFFELGKSLPELSSEIFIEARIL